MLYISVFLRHMEYRFFCKKLTFKMVKILSAKIFFSDGILMSDID